MLRVSERLVDHGLQRPLLLLLVVLLLLLLHHQLAVSGHGHVGGHRRRAVMMSIRWVGA